MPLFIFIIKDFSLSLSERTVLTSMHLVSENLGDNASGAGGLTFVWQASGQLVVSQWLRSLTCDRKSCF